MTTSILSPCSANLNGHDIQTLRDFALSAPYEWRKALSALADLAAKADGEDDDLSAKEELKALREEVGDAVETLKASLAEMLKIRNANGSVKDIHEALDDYEKEVGSTLSDLETSAISDD